MKKRMITLLLALCLGLAGCTSMLERDYLLVSPYEPVSAAGGGSSSALRVESYQDLVNAVIYLVSRGEEHGVLNLYNYTRDVEADLTSACLEVVQEDPLGAYAVDYIKHDYSLIVSYYEANIDITYRCTPEQMASIVSVTGSSAIRRELVRTLTGFSSEAVLRVSYFDEDADYILELVRQAYYDNPSVAMGMPETEIYLYPETGQQRIVEIILTYSESTETLRRRSQELTELARSYRGSDVESLYAALSDGLTVDEGEGHSSAYAALIERTADSEGAALAWQLLCAQANVESVLVRGTLDGAPHFWNIVTDEEGESRHVDLSAGLYSMTDAQLTQTGPYEWDHGGYPVCGIPEEEPEENMEEGLEEDPEEGQEEVPEDVLEKIFEEFEEIL